jgi:endonuclease/exonuclease/phosphatase family metal-dependent hydrolase
MKVMTFNTRTPTPHDGINMFDFRKDRILDVLQREKPDLIGFQELKQEGKDWLCRALGGEYLFLGVGRDADLNGEGTPVAVRWDTFSVIGMEQFWLSDTPDIPGTRYENSDQSSCCRIAVAAKLLHKKSGRVFTFLNTHTDHKGEMARQKGLLQIAEYLKTCAGEKIVTGDMNATPDSAEIQAFLKAVNPLGVKDCTGAVGNTFHGYNTTCSIKIDYVFSNMKTVTSHAVEDVPVGGVYYSDHLAVCAELDFE